MRGGHHVTSLDRLTVLNLEFGVGGTVTGVGNRVAADQNALQNDELKALDRLGTPIRHAFHIHRHLGRGVECFEHQLCAQQLHTLNRLHQLVVFERQALGCLQAEVRTIRLLDMSKIRELCLVGDGVFLNWTQQQT